MPGYNTPAAICSWRKKANTRAFCRKICASIAEKALKAVCIKLEVDFPKVHSISHLMDILEANDLSIPEPVKAADILTQYAVQARYPGPIEEITLEGYRDTLELAAKVVFWIETTIT